MPITPIITTALRLLPALLLLLTPLAHAGDHHTVPAPLDRWYIMEMSGQRAGYMHTTRTVTEDTVTTSSRTQLKIKRGELELEMSMSSEFIETPEGRPISMAQITNFGGTPTATRYTFHDDHIEQTTAIRTTRLDLPDGTWLPPAAASVYTARRLEAGATEITLRTIDPSAGPTPIVIERTDITPAEVKTATGTVKGLRATSTASNYPQFQTTEYLDTKGEMLRSTIDLGMLKIDVLAADRDTALADATDAPELMTSLFITPNQEIANPRRTTKATYTLSVPDGHLEDLPTAAHQRTDRVSDSAIRVTIDTTIPPVPFADKINRAVYLAPSATLQADDPRVRTLTTKALAGHTDATPAEQAEHLRRFVHNHITAKGLAVGFASAAETAASAEGDCTEHAVLLAAMLRANKIPARVASGLIYADQFAGSKDIFGYHMWTQALLIGQDGLPHWVDLDATLPAWLPTDATHIALATSPLADDNPAAGLVELAPLMGRLAITVESAE